MGQKDTDTKQNTKLSGSGKATHISVYLVRAGKTMVDALTENARALPQYSSGGTTAYVLSHKDVAPPWWWDEVLAPLDLGGTAPEQSFPGAVLFVQASLRLFAITFGSGRSFLDFSAIERNFGLRAVLNSVDAGGIRSIDLGTLESSPLMTRKQRRDAQPLAGFGVDRVHELMKGVTGRRRAHSAVIRDALIDGADGANVTVKDASLATMVEACSELLRDFKKDLDPEFAWVDNLRLERDKPRLEACKSALAKRFLKGEWNCVTSLGPSRPLDGEKLSRLRFSWSNKAFDDRTALDDLFARIKDLGGTGSVESVLDRLRADRVNLMSPDMKTVEEHWRIIDCLGADLTVGQFSYVLSGGMWYRINKIYRAVVEAEFDQIVRNGLAVASSLSLPPWANEKDEGEYNAKASKLLPLALLDEKNYYLGNSKIELCDLLDSQNGYLVHVKRGRGAASLSHLFNQGVVSALTVLDDPSAREHLKSKTGLDLSATVFGEKRLAEKKIVVVFAVVDVADGVKWRLPFFSMLAATHAIKRIGERGLAAHVIRIDQPTPMGSGGKRSAKTSPGRKR